MNVYHEGGMYDELMPNIKYIEWRSNLMNFAWHFNPDSDDDTSQDAEKFFGDSVSNNVVNLLFSI